MFSHFADVLWIVCGLGMLGGVLSLIGSSSRWDVYTKRGMFMESAQPGRRAPVSVNTVEAERVAEIRQLVEATNHRRTRRGERPLDVEAEVARLSALPEPDRGATG